MVQFKWGGDDKQRWVEVGDKRFVVLEGKFEEVVELAGLLDEERGVLRTLRQADAAFATGQADYHDAVDRLKDLRRETMKAATLTVQRASQISAFFSPPTIVKAFGEDSKAFSKFVDDALQRLVKTCR